MDAMEKDIKRCELNPEKVCDNCNECNICDLDPNKLCDSCGKCLNIDDRNFLDIEVDDIELEEDYDEGINSSKIDPKEMEKWEKILNESKDDEIKVEYIEDIQELKEEYDKKIEEILKELAKDR